MNDNREQLFWEAQDELNRLKRKVEKLEALLKNKQCLCCLMTPCMHAKAHKDIKETNDTP